MLNKRKLKIVLEGIQNFQIKLEFEIAYFDNAVDFSDDIKTLSDQLLKINTKLIQVSLLLDLLKILAGELNNESK